MPTEKWIYKGKIKHHAVEVTHSSSTGYLLVKLNGDILICATNQVSTKDYYLIIDGMICIFSLVGNENGFSYDFRESDVNFIEEVKDEKRFKWMFSSIATFFALLIILPLSFIYYNKHKKDDYYLKRHGESTIGYVHFTERETDSKPELSYTFLVNEQTYKGRIEEFRMFNDQIVTSYGMPLLAGDEFLVKYDPENPKWNLILLNNPSQNQINKYIKMLSNEVLTETPLKLPEYELKQYLDCIIESLIGIYGMKAFAGIYYRNYNEMENPEYNETFFADMLANVYFTRDEAKCRSYITTQIVVDHD